MKDQNDHGQLRRETKTGIKRVGDARKRMAKLEQMGIPKEHDDFLDLRDEIQLLLDHLLAEEKMDLETSHMIRNKLRRIEDLFQEMGEDGHYDREGEAQLTFDKEKQDSKLHIVQLMLSQIFPELKKAI